MTSVIRDGLDERLLEDWQRELPVVARPFAVMAEALGIDESEVLKRLETLRATGAIGRVGAVVRPNTLGASTLAALNAPEFDIDETAAKVAAEPGVNHVYLRENDWNLWFVVTGSDRSAVDGALQRISLRTGRRVLDLRLEKSYHIDLGFPLSGRKSARDPRAQPRADASCYKPLPGDRDLVQSLMVGLPLVPRPFLEIADRLGRSENEVMARLGELNAIGIIPRLGVIVRHRALGWRSNAMVVWDVDPGVVDRAGRKLASCSGIHLCYRRTRYESEWPYNLYCMVHAKSREEALATLIEAAMSAGLEGYPREILFSLRCFKQTGALVAPATEAA